MFEQSFVDVRASARKPWAFAASVAFQLTGLAAVLLASLFLTEALPQARLSSFLVAPLPPIAAAVPTAPAQQPTRTPRAFNPLVAPTSVPPKVVSIDDSDLPIGESVPGAIPGATGATAGSMMGNFLQNIPTQPTPPPAAKPKATSPEAAKPVPVGGDVQAANLVRKVVPVYPQLAKQARISGKVRFTAIIAVDGAIQNLQLIDGHPLLVKAAREAVSQWLYRPTLLNGKPVEVITQIEVNFTLNH